MGEILRRVFHSSGCSRKGKGGMSSLLDVEGVQVMAIMPLSRAADSVRGVLNTMAALW